MFERHQHAPRAVYLLADSLDSILASCEDLLGEEMGSGLSLRLELSAITHVLQARRHIDDLGGTEPLVTEQCVLFLVGTGVLDVAHLRGERRLQDEHLPRISDGYLIGQQLPLGILAQLAGALLDALETHFVLYDDPVEPFSVNVTPPERADPLSSRQ